MFAAYLTNVPVDMTEPDGSILNCFASGDEYYSRLHDADGYTIIQNAENGFYYYAQKNNQKIVPSIYRANESHDLNQYGINPNIVISKSAYQNIRERWWNGIERRDAPTIGTVNNLNVFIRFSDEPEFSGSFSLYDTPFNLAQGPSMRHYFDEVSYGTLDVPTTHFPIPNGSVVISYQDQYPRSYYEIYNPTSNPNGYTDDQRTEREHTLLANAISAISSEVSPGTVQLPPNGQPIILLNDSQTTGGYKKIGVIPRFELSKLSQKPISSRIKFSEISLSDSISEFREMRTEFDNINIYNYINRVLEINGRLISVQILENNSIMSISDNEQFDIIEENFE